MTLRHLCIAVAAAFAVNVAPALADTTLDYEFFKARVAPFNVNYRYVAEELQYLLTDSGASGIVVHSRFAPTLAEVLPAGTEALLILDPTLACLPPQGH